MCQKRSGDRPRRACPLLTEGPIAHGVLRHTGLGLCDLPLRPDGDTDDTTQGTTTGGIALRGDGARVATTWGSKGHASTNRGTGGLACGSLKGITVLRVECRANRTTGQAPTDDPRCNREWAAVARKGANEP